MSDLKKRFQFILEQKQKNLLRESQSVLQDAATDDQLAPGTSARSRSLVREICVFLGFVGVAYGLAWLIRMHLVDRILEEAYVTSRDWLKPPDETMIQVEVHQEFWRAHGIFHLYALVCLIGCYLTRGLAWALQHPVVEWLTAKGGTA